jgi:hypothetical protein
MTRATKGTGTNAKNNTPPFLVQGNNRRFGHVSTGIGELKTTIDHTPYHPDNKFEDFPPAPRLPPFHMGLEEILHPTEMTKIASERKLVFHCVGDTGNFKNDMQIKVAKVLADDLPKSGAKFFYHFGDVIYVAKPRN